MLKVPKARRKAAMRKLETGKDGLVAKVQEDKVEVRGPAVAVALAVADSNFPQA